MKRLSIIIIALMVFSSNAFAAGCYTPQQYRAEQALRFHTNLMVFGLYCKPILKQDTYGAYQQFTARNQNVVRGQENQLISYYKDSKSASPEKALHSLRTDLANKTSLQASKSIISFCRQYANAYTAAKAMKPADFQRWIEEINVKATAPTNRTLCAAPQRAK